MSIFQRFMCGTISASTIPHAICKTPEQSLRILPRLNVSTSPVGACEAKSTQKSSNNSQNKTNWTVVYRLPLVRWASAINRLKVYQGMVTIAGIPIAFILEKAELLPVDTSVVIGAVGISGIMTLSLFSLVVKNLIGFIYINRDTNQLKFAYVDYWGRRQDAIVDIDDVVPDGAQETPTRLNFYHRISLQSNKKLSFKLLQRFGIIDQPEIFSALFY